MKAPTAASRTPEKAGHSPSSTPSGEDPGPVPTGIGSHYSWLFAGGYIPALFLLTIGCAPSDSRVVAFSYQTTAEYGVRVAAEGPTHLEPVPAYFLVAEDHTQCEVDSTAYVAAKVGSRVACDWSHQ